MSDKQKRTQEEQGNAFDFSCCRGQSQTQPDQLEGHNRAAMMSRVMEMCRSVKSETTAPPEEPGTSDIIV